MKTHWKYLVVTLVIGWFLGAASGGWLSRHPRPMGSPEKHFAKMRNHLYKELKLTPEQLPKVEAILQESRQKLDQVFDESRPRAEAIHNASKAKIRALLAPEQQVRFDRLSERWERKFKKRFDRPH